MKKKLLTLAAISLLVLPVVILAQDTTIPDTITGAGDIITIIERVANWLFAILLALALLFILIAAFQFLTSGGDPGKVGTARQALTYALIGIAVAFLAKGLVLLVKFVLGIA